MARGAYLAGRAINISKTTASHAMSYALTTRFGIPHGQAVVVTLPELLIFNAGVTTEDVADARGIVHVHRALTYIRQLFGTNTIESAAVELRTLVRDTGLTPQLSDLGVGKEDIDELVKSMSVERAGNNPRNFTEESARCILRNSLYNE